jgi:pimeloyl-ACP methyl ester carboxylesterase
MPDDLIQSFLMAETGTRLRMVLNDDHAPALRRYLGQEAYAEYRALAAYRLPGEHLGITAARNLVFIPGVMGTLLQSSSKGGIWWVDVRTRHHIDDLRLDPSGRRDADPDNAIVPSTVDTSYEPFLTAVLGRDDLGHVLYPYDWRKPLWLSSAALRDLVIGLYEQNGNQPVHLVAHSMGGLIVQAALLDHSRDLWPRLGKLVFIGTPHYGSPAIAGYLKNHLWGFELMAVLGLFLSRATYRSLWGVLGMLPAPRGMYPGTRMKDPAPWLSPRPDDAYVHPCLDFDPYEAGAWKLDLTTVEMARLQAVLNGVGAFHRRLHEAHQALDQMQRDRMLVIAGVGYKTLFRLANDRRFFGLWEHMTKITERIAGDPHREGDGRVPLASATLDNVPIRYVRGVHGGLPNMPAVYEDVFRWLKEEPLRLPDTVYGALSDHLAADAASDAPHLDGTTRASAFGDDPGVLELEPLQQARLDAMLARLDAEQLPEFNRIRLL